MNPLPFVRFFQCANASTARQGVHRHDEKCVANLGSTTPSLSLGLCYTLQPAPASGKTTTVALSGEPSPLTQTQDATFDQGFAFYEGLGRGFANDGTLYFHADANRKPRQTHSWTASFGTNRIKVYPSCSKRTLLPAFFRLENRITYDEDEISAARKPSERRFFREVQVTSPDSSRRELDIVFNAEATGLFAK